MCIRDRYATLGWFIPLIVVNCILLGRAEALAAKNGPVPCSKRFGASQQDTVYHNQRNKQSQSSIQRQMCIRDRSDSYGIIYGKI